MSSILRGVLLITALVTATWILGKIYKCKIKLNDAIYWICMAVVLVILGIFPQIAYGFTNLIGIQAPVNFIFLFMLAMVIVKLFMLSIKVSQLEEKVTILSAEIAIRSKDVDMHDKSDCSNMLKGEFNEI